MRTVFKTSLLIREILANFLSGTLFPNDHCTFMVNMHQFQLRQFGLYTSAMRSSLPVGHNPSLYSDAMRTSEDRAGPLVTCTGNPCQSTGTSSPVSTGDLPVLPAQVTNGPDRSSEVLIGGCIYAMIRIKPTTRITTLLFVKSGKGSFMCNV